ncbi:amino acid ABC transporter substrate-binding protein, PAAT family [Streptomyces zhaozhouensis]|uniref:Amino acid ABC transporter substrate-binding protein, PAAT family n=1 Tax=Streptomyces zhaozhouensis TaxID=1300267 RepID=A0A286DQ60_9ACTN|nr:ABC transporter substrate-binding protein [Streptomyces zhaozhouensis]SOD60805.1 amino acid ABC transporter substrate-binding protein, PAAT family [Streptomyces zhaozhouensis]
MTARLTRRSRLAAAGAVAAAGVLLLGACGDQTDDADSGSGGSGSGGGGESGEAAGELFDLLPQDIQDAGEIKVGSDIAYAPIEFIDENDEIAGIDPDIGAALGEVLGVDFVFENGTFDGLILGLNNGRHDVIMSAMTDTAERQQGVSEDAEGGADFVNYFQAGSALLVAADNPEGVESVDDLCGLSVAAQQGTANEAVIEAAQENCDEPIEPVINEVDSESITALQNGRADVVVTDYPVALYNELTAGGGDLFTVVGEQIDAAPYGIAVSKENTELRDALQAAVQEIIDNGAYAEVLAEWSAEAGAIEEATVNAGE